MQSSNKREKQQPEKDKQQLLAQSQQNGTRYVFYLRKQLSQIIADLQHIDCAKWEKFIQKVRGVQIFKEEHKLIDYSLECVQALAFQQQKSAKSYKLNEFDVRQLDYLIYLLKTTSLSKIAYKQQIWKCRQFYIEGDRLLKNINSIQLWHKFLNKSRITQILLLNRLHYCLRFDMLQKGLQTLQQLSFNIYKETIVLNRQLMTIKNTILIKMGCKAIDQLPRQPLYTQEIHQYEYKSKNNELCLQIVTVSKQTLPTLIQSMRDQQLQISGQNLYNLALACRKLKYYDLSIQILTKLINSKTSTEQSRFISKCLTILSQVHEQSGNLSQALATIKQIQVKQQRDLMQCEYRKQILMKKIKLEKGAKTCPGLTRVQTKKLNLITGLQNQLNQLISHSHKTSFIPKKRSSKIYESISARKTMKKLQLPNLNTIKSTESRKTDIQSNKTHIKFKYKNSLSTECQTFGEMHLHFKTLKQTETQNNIKLLKQSRTKQVEYTKMQVDLSGEVREQPNIIEVKEQTKIFEFQENKINQEQSQMKCEKSQQKKKKNVQFHQQQNEKAIDIIYKGQERITSLFLCESYSSVQSQIHFTLSQLKQEPTCLQINKFIIKCVKWYRCMGKNNESISLLKNTINAIDQEREDGVQFKKQCLKLLGQIYQQQKDSKNAVNIYLQLANLGAVDYYDKLGQLELLKQHYLQSIKYYELFNQQKQSIYSKSKLAHVYSKMPIYKKKAVDLLNQMLFQNKNCLIFRRFEVEEIEDVQKAVLLIVSIYMSYQSGIDKAKVICQKFLQINFSAYPIYYMLGIIYEEEGRKEEAFNAYLTALKLKPNHIPSLIRIVNDIGIQNGNNYQIINILRKAYVQESRNWELLQLLIQSITLKKQDENKPSVQELVKYAKILEKAEVGNGDMDFQIEMVWTWAFETMECRRRKQQVVEDDNQNQINMRLGEINMIKGNFRASEFYLKKVLAKLQLRRKRTVRRRNGKMKLEQQALIRLSYIKAKQNQSSEIKLMIGDTLNAAKDEIEERLSKIIVSSRHF